MAMYFQWIGCGFGVLGALLLALNVACSAWGFVAFLVSNVAWICFALLTGTPGLLFMQLAMTATSLLGIYRWTLRTPPKRNARAREDVLSC